MTRHDRRRQYIAAFVASRRPQRDEEFLQQCGIDMASRDAEIALAVREAVAESCGVDGSLIRATDRFSHELDPLWAEDSLDAIEFIVHLEERLPRPLSDRDAERIRHPFTGSATWTVSDMATNVIGVIGTDRTGT